MQQPLPVRLKHIQNDVIAPIQQFAPQFPFDLRLKKMWKPYAVAEILQLEIPNLKHGNDGLIFTPVSDPYRAGTCESILKWKPSEMNTVDFLLRVNHDTPIESERLELWVGNRDGESFYSHHSWDPKLLQYDGLVVECRLISEDANLTSTRDLKLEHLNHNYNTQSADLDAGLSEGSRSLVHLDSGERIKNLANRIDVAGEFGPRWKYIRVRRDKITGNNIRVVQKILESISDNVTSDELIAALPSIRRAWKTREAAVGP